MDKLTSNTENPTSNTETNDQPTVPAQENTSSEKQTHLQPAEKETASARDDTTSAAKR